MNAAVELLLSVVPRCHATTLDALARGEVTGPVRDTLARLDPMWRAVSEPEMTRALLAWYDLEASPEAVVTDGTLFATESRSGTPASPLAEVVAVRPNQSIPGARVVTVRCPYAHLHDYRRRGHEFHDHGWSRAAQPNSRGSLGHRVPHCDMDLPHYELMLPAALREAST